MVTRRCSERRFFLRPDAETVSGYLYCLAFAAERTGVSVLFTMCNANHHHTGIIDREGRLPEFLHLFHLLLGKHQNALRGRWESMWAASEQSSVVELVNTEDVMAKMVYALTNPVKDGLVQKAHHWPGASSLRANLSGQTVVARRPRVLFDPEGSMPETVAIRFARPPGLEALPQHEFAALLGNAIGAVEADTAVTLRTEGRRVMGRAQVLRQHWNDRPGSKEPRRGRSPRIACRNKWRRIEAIQRNRGWLEAYRDARQRWLAGLDATFPAGTWWLARCAKVPVASA